MKNLIAGMIFAMTAIFVTTAGRADGTNSVAAPTPYPLDHCVVSGDKFDGSMGAPIEYIYQTNGINQEIKFCCPLCKPEFLKDPDKYMKIIQKAEAAK
jgi:YHS domain-containing protein